MKLKLIHLNSRPSEVQMLVYNQIDSPSTIQEAVCTLTIKADHSRFLLKKVVKIIGLWVLLFLDHKYKDVNNSLKHGN